MYGLCGMNMIKYVSFLREGGVNNSIVRRIEAS